jgi:hypothetical protein
LNLGAQQTLLGQKRSQRDPAHARGHVSKEAPAVEQVAAQEQPGTSGHYGFSLIDGKGEREIGS